MDIALVDVSDIKLPGQKRYDIKEVPGEICETRKIPLENITEDIISCEEISCERMKLGVVNNCVICENKNNDIFVRCKIKYKA